MLSFTKQQNAHDLIYGTFFPKTQMLFCSKHYGRMHKVHEVYDVYGVLTIH